MLPLTNISLGIQRNERMGLTVKGIPFFSVQSFLGCFEDPHTDRRQFDSFLMFFYPRATNHFHFTFKENINNNEAYANHSNYSSSINN